MSGKEGGEEYFSLILDLRKCKTLERTLNF